MSRSIVLLAVLVCLILTILPATTASTRHHPPLQSLLSRPAATLPTPAADTSVRSTLPHALRDVHFVNNMTVATGSWTGTISMLYQYLTFVDAAGATIQSFPVTPDTPYQFGTVLYDGDSFDVMYQITLVEGGDSPITRTDRRVCLFVISAYSAGKPQIMTVPFNGKVNCTWTNDGFYQSFRAE